MSEIKLYTTPITIHIFTAIDGFRPWQNYKKTSSQSTDEFFSTGNNPEKTGNNACFVAKFRLNFRYPLIFGDSDLLEGQCVSHMIVSKM